MKDNFEEQVREEKGFPQERSRCGHYVIDAGFGTLVTSRSIHDISSMVGTSDCDGSPPSMDLFKFVAAFYVFYIMAY